jgi:hypothetical protein
MIWPHLIHSNIILKRLIRNFVSADAKSEPGGAKDPLITLGIVVRLAHTRQTALDTVIIDTTALGYTDRNLEVQRFPCCGIRTLTWLAPPDLVASFVSSFVSHETFIRRFSIEHIGFRASSGVGTHCPLPTPMDDFAIATGLVSSFLHVLRLLRCQSIQSKAPDCERFATRCR